jgi:hypothetical protein
MTKISTLVQLGAIKFSPKKGDEPGHVVIEYILAGEDQIALLPELVDLQQGICNLVLKAGRAGTWKGLVYFRAATIKPPDKKRQTTIVGTVACFEELAKLQDLARLRIAATEFDSDLATLTAERVQQELPLEFGGARGAVEDLKRTRQEVADSTGGNVEISAGSEASTVAEPRRGRRKRSA